MHIMEREMENNKEELLGTKLQCLRLKIHWLGLTED